MKLIYKRFVRHYLWIHVVKLFRFIFEIHFFEIKVLQLLIWMQFDSAGVTLPSANDMDRLCTNSLFCVIVGLVGQSELIPRTTV